MKLSILHAFMLAALGSLLGALFMLNQPNKPIEYTTGRSWRMEAFLQGMRIAAVQAALLTLPWIVVGLVIQVLTK